MLFSQMFPVRYRSKSFPTMMTEVCARFLSLGSAVNFLVRIQRVVGVSHEVAFIALDRLFARVPPEVDGQLVRPEKFLPANPTLQILLRPFLPLYLEFPCAEFNEALPEKEGGRFSFCNPHTYLYASLPVVIRKVRPNIHFLTAVAAFHFVHLWMFRGHMIYQVIGGVEWQEAVGAVALPN